MRRTLLLSLAVLPLAAAALQDTDDAAVRASSLLAYRPASSSEAR